MSSGKEKETILTPNISSGQPLYSLYCHHKEIPFLPKEELDLLVKLLDSRQREREILDDVCQILFESRIICIVELDLHRSPYITRC